MVDILVPQTLFGLVVITAGALATCGAAVLYLRKVRLERPVIGVFNGRDIAVLFVFIVSLPLLYLFLPQWGLTTFLVVTFAASLSIGYRPVVSRAVLWTSIGLLLGVNIWLARTMLGTVTGWQVYWAETSVVALLGAVAVTNLYVQGGMRFQHVAWFVLGLAVYDAIFTTAVPLTATLADRFIGFPLDPAIGMRVGLYNADIGLGDLLAYALFVTAALKAYGGKAAAACAVVVALFGSAAPVLSPLVLDSFSRGATNLVIPAQTFFGPVAFLLYLALRRHYGRERTTGEYFAALDSSKRGAAEAASPVSPAPAGATEQQPVGAAR
jgi:hypothetical protein